MFIKLLFSDNFFFIFLLVEIRICRSSAPKYPPAVSLFAANRPTDITHRLLSVERSRFSCACFHATLLLRQTAR